MSQELENRFHQFGKAVRDFCFKIELGIINREYVRPVIRSSGSIGANYLEASDDLGRLDERMKIKISRREAKETIHWFDLIKVDAGDLESERQTLLNEAEQIRRILSAILKRLN